MHDDLALFRRRFQHARGVIQRLARLCGEAARWLTSYGVTVESELLFATRTKARVGGFPLLSLLAF